MTEFQKIQRDINVAWPDPVRVSSPKEKVWPLGWWIIPGLVVSIGLWVMIFRLIF